MKHLIPSKPTVALIVFIFIVGVMPLFVAEFTVTLFNYIGLYALVALGLVLLTGIGGLTSFGQAAFVGLGAYTTAYLTTAHGVSPWGTLLVGIAITTAISFALGFITCVCPAIFYRWEPLPGASRCITCLAILMDWVGMVVWMVFRRSTCLGLKCRPVGEFSISSGLVCWPPLSPHKTC